MVHSTCLVCYSVTSLYNNFPQNKQELLFNLLNYYHFSFMMFWFFPNTKRNWKTWTIQYENLLCLVLYFFTFFLSEYLYNVSHGLILRTNEKRNLGACSIIYVRILYPPWLTDTHLLLCFDMFFLSSSSVSHRNKDTRKYVWKKIKGKVFFSTTTKKDISFVYFKLVWKFIKFELKWTWKFVALISLKGNSSEFVEEEFCFKI